MSTRVAIRNFVTPRSQIQGLQFVRGNLAPRQRIGQHHLLPTEVARVVLQEVDALGILMHMSALKVYSL